MVVKKKKSVSTSSSTSKKSISKKSTKKTTAKKATLRKTPSKKSTARTASKKSTKRTSKKSSKRTSKRNDVSNLSGNDVSGKLEQLEFSAKNLNQQMDDVVGLPPLPGNDFNPEFHSKDNLDQHKTDFFSKILKGPAKEKKQKTEDKQSSVDIVDDLAQDVKKDNLDNLEHLETDIETSGAPPAELKEMEKEEKEMNALEKDITAVPEAFKKEEPHKREIPLKLETPKKPEMKDGTSKDEKTLELPPADTTHKLEPKKGFLAKLFGSKPKPSHDLSKKYTSDDVKELHSINEIPDFNGEIVDDKTIGAIVEGKTPDTSTTEVPMQDAKKDVKDESVDPKEEKKDAKMLEKLKTKDKPDMPEKNAPKSANDIFNDTPELLKNAEAKNASENAEPQTVAESTTDTPETQEVGTREYNTGFVSDSIEGEMATRGEPAATKAEQLAPSADSEDVDTSEKVSPQKEKLTNVSISKLDAKRKKLEEEVAELEQKLKASKAEYEDKTVKVEKKERELDKRESDLDERENILLTLQTDLIRERKELDNREFQLFMRDEHKEPSEKPTIRLSMEEKALPQGLSNERLKIEQLMNQTRTMAINKEYDKAKHSYNRVVQVFHSTPLQQADRQMLHLSIKELYHDISMLMKSSQPGEQDGSRVQ
jgi:hypothetical protein